MGLTGDPCYKAKCFQNVCGVNCRLLTHPIHDKPCPFYKTDEEVSEDRRKAVDRLEEINRYDLIDKYIYNTKRNW